MTDVTVTFAISYPDASPREFGTVLVRLLDAGGGGVLSDGGVIVDAQRVTLDANGEGSIVLARNSDLTPAGTFYHCTVERSSPTVTRSIRLTSGTASTVAWSDAGIQVVSPLPPSYTAANRVLPDPTLGSDGDVPTVASGGYVLAPGGGGSGYPIHAAQAIIADFVGDGTGITTIDLIDQHGGAIFSGVPRSSFVGGTVAVLSGANNGGKLFTITTSGAFTPVAAAVGDFVAILTATLPRPPGLLVKQTAEWVPFAPVVPGQVRYVHHTEADITVAIDSAGALVYNYIESDVDEGTPYTVHLPQTAGSEIFGALVWRQGTTTGDIPDVTFSVPGGTPGTIGHGRDLTDERTWKLNQTGTLIFVHQGGRRWYLASEDYDAKRRILYPTVTAGAVTVEVVLQDYAEITLTEDTTITVTSFVSQATTDLVIVQDATGGWAVTWAGDTLVWQTAQPAFGDGAGTKKAIRLEQVAGEVWAWDESATGSGGGSVATDTIYDAKGDLPVGTGSNTAAKLTVGANDTIPVADSTATTGIKWAAPSVVRTALGLVIGTNVPSGTGSASGTNTGDETTTTIGTLTSGATAKTTPIDADLLPLSDSAASNIIKKLSLTNLKAFLKTYFDTLYDATGAAAAVTATSISAAPTARTITAGTGLTGGGDLTANRTLAIDTATTVDKTTAQTLTNKTLTSPAITTPTGIVKGDVGLGNVTNNAQLTIANNLSDVASAATSWTNLGGGALGKLAYSPQAVRVIPSARTSGGSGQVVAPLVPVVAGASTVALALGRQMMARAIHSGQTVTKVYVAVSATALTGSQTIEVVCYNEQTDGTPGTRAWTTNITVGTSTGVLDSGTVSLVMPTGPCWIGVLNPSGNAGTVTLRTGVPTMAAAFIYMANASFNPVIDVTATAASSSDMSAYLLRSSSTGSTVIGVDTAAAIPIIGGTL